MKSQVIRSLSRQDAESNDLITSEIISAREETFRKKGAGTTEMPPKPGVYLKPNASLYAKPASIRKSGVAGIKRGSAFSENPQKQYSFHKWTIHSKDHITGIPYP